MSLSLISLYSEGKTWKIPANAEKPKRKMSDTRLLNRLQEEQGSGLNGRTQRRNHEKKNLFYYHIILTFYR